MEKCEKLERFCYCCGHYMPQRQKKSKADKQKDRTLKNRITAEFKLAYKLYYDQPEAYNEPFAPSNVCKNCYNHILEWMHGKRPSMLNGTPAIWTADPRGHLEETCYACVNYAEGSSRKKEKTYISTLTCAIPVPHRTNTEFPKPPSPSAYSQLTDIESFAGFSPIADPNYAQPSTSTRTRDGPDLVTKHELDNLVAIMELSKERSERLARFIKKKRLHDGTVKSSFYRKRNKPFMKYYTADEAGTTAFCNDIMKLMELMEINYNPDEWRLFIDGSASALKAVLLHKSKNVPSVALYYSTAKKENYIDLADLLDKIKYKDHKWRICCDLKVVNILRGMKGGFPHHFCFICDWDTRSKEDHYTYTGWEKRKEGKDKTLSMDFDPLVEIDNILLPPLHIKLGIVQKFISHVLKANDVAFDFLKGVFRKLSDGKLKKGLF